MNASSYMKTFGGAVLKHLCIYCILLVNSHVYYKLYIAVGVVTNQDFYIEITRKV